MPELTVVEVVQWIWSHIVQIVLVLSFFFEISKVKVKPLSWIMKLLLKPIREEMDEMKKELNANIDSVREEMKSEIDSLLNQQISENERIDSLIEANEMTEISRLRWEIIEFSNSIENGNKHIRDEYRHIKDDAKRYHTLISKYNLDNGIIEEEMQKINKHYEANKGTSTVYF